MLEELKIKPPVDKNNPTHYIDKRQFYVALVDYRKTVESALEHGEEKPQIPEYIGDCFLRIAKGVAMKHNFRNYSFLNDMISTGVETCLRYILSFNPTKSTEPFSYFTTVVWWAFIGVITKEKKQTDIKRKAFFEIDQEVFSTQDSDDGEFRISLNEYIQSLGTDKDMKKEIKKAPQFVLDIFNDD